MRILITGAAGFIGSHLVKYCAEQGHQVLAIDNDWDNGKHELFIKYDNVQCRECDVAKTKYILGITFRDFKPDVCYHLAAYASEGRSNHIRSFIHSNNTVGTANVINACINNKCKLVFTSSVAVYSGIPPFNEKDDPNPIDEYGLSKYTSERSIVIAGDTQGLDFCIIRPRNVYGPGQNIFDRSRNLFGIFCYNALNNLPLTVFGEGSNTRSFTYIDDIIPPLYRAKDVKNEIINLGSPHSHTIKEATYVFMKVSGYDYMVYGDERHEVRDAYCHTFKSEELLGYKHKTSLETGLTHMWHWAKQQSMRPLDVMPELEVLTNAHSSLK